MFRFEKLDAWQLAIAFANEIYAVTRAYPSDERFGLVSQTRRAAVSIAANISEGAGRLSGNDRARFVEIAYGSLMEVVSHIHIARDQGFLASEKFQSLYEQADRLARVLSGFRDSLIQSVKG